LLITAAVGPVLDDILASASPTTIGGGFLDHPFILLITYLFTTTDKCNNGKILIDLLLAIDQRSLQNL